MSASHLPARLALLGGRPAFDHPRHVGQPNLGDRERLFARLGEMLDRAHLTNNGPLVRELEARLAAMLGVEHCVATCNASIALQIALRALGMTGEVVLPAFTFAASAHAVVWAGGTPRFCDIAPDGFTLDPDAVAAAIDERTRGIMGVHLWGRPCDVERLERVARAHDLPLLFDASQAFACGTRGRLIGGFGDAEVLSFHATKIVNAFEGGAILTRHAALADRLRRLRDHGFRGKDDVVDAGTNGKMSEASAAMGLTSIDALDRFLAVNRDNHLAYRRGLQGIPGCRLIEDAVDDARERRNHHYVVLEIDEAQAGLDRDTLMRALHAENVIARRYFYPGCHRMPPYAEGAATLPRTDHVAGRVLCMPTGTAVSLADVATICALVASAIAQAPAIRARLAVGAA